MYSTQDVFHELEKINAILKDNNDLLRIIEKNTRKGIETTEIVNVPKPVNKSEKL